MSLESLLSYTKEDLLLDTSYTLCVLSYITPLTLGAYSGITNATNINSAPSLLLPALCSNTLGTTTLVALNTNRDTTRKRIKFAALGALSAAITAPLLYGLGYSIGYCAGKIIY